MTSNVGFASIKCRVNDKFEIIDEPVFNHKPPPGVALEELDKERIHKDLLTDCKRWLSQQKEPLPTDKVGFFIEYVPKKYLKTKTPQ